MKKIPILFILLLFLTTVAFAGTVNLPQTGQTKCYETSGAEIPCAGTGQDGEIQAGVAWPNPRFEANSDTTITDNLTGLIWASNGNIMPTRNPGWDTDDTTNDGCVTWEHALDYVAKLNNENYLGHNDWRLPNVNELESLINANEVSTAYWLNNHGFANVQFSYWSSTTSSYPLDALAIAVSIWNGMVYAGYKDGHDYYMFSVWPVRAGQADLSDSAYPANIWKTGQTTSYSTGDDGELGKGVIWPTPRFTDHGNGTVTDNLTGLMWTKNANAPGPMGCNPGTYKMWQEALDYVTCLNSNAYLGYSDWRLPNRKELHSLTDNSKYLPSLQFGHPFANVMAHYWSSTTGLYYSGCAWAVDMMAGSVICEVNSCAAWPVRSGPWVISGTVTLSGLGLSGVTMTLSGAASITTATDSSGNYSFSGLNNGTYIITPSKSGYTFTPTSKAVNISNADQTGVNFTSSQCVLDISPTSQSFTSLGGTGTVIVTNQGGCAWTATSNATWVIITSGNSGSGNGTVYYSVSAKATPGSRTGTITIAGETFTVEQDGCKLSIDPATQSFAVPGGTGYITVKAESGCSWTATSGAYWWITITSGANGTGDGTVYYSVLPNASACTRIGLLTVGDQSCTVTQEGGTCAYTISPTGQVFDYLAGSAYLSVTTENCCTWSATSDSSWIMITSGMNSTGNGNVNYSVSENPSTARIGSIIIEGGIFTVIQDGNPIASCSNWGDVITKYQIYVYGHGIWNDVITCYNQYSSQ